MAGTSNDPFGSLSTWQRWSLRTRLWRAWRLGVAERDATTARRLADSAEGRPVVAIWNTGPDRHARTVARTTAAIRFGDGLTVRLAGCHLPTVTLLERVSAQASWYLETGRHHGSVWGLYFRSTGGQIGLLARRVCVELRNPPGPEGGPTIGAPAAPAAVLGSRAVVVPTARVMR